MPTATDAGLEDATAASTSPGIDWGIDLGGGGGGDAEVAPPAGGINWDFGADLMAEGDSAAAPPPAGGIDWDLGALLSAEGGEASSSPAAEAVAEAGGISWDIGSALGAGGGDGLADGASVGIDWAIDLSGAGAAETPAIAIDWDIGTAPTAAPLLSPPTGGGDRCEGTVVGRAAVVLRVERDADYRSRLTEDLQELRAFLMQV